MKNVKLEYKQSKERSKKVLDKKGIITFFLLVLVFPLFSQIEQSKKVEKTFDLSKGGIVKVDHRYGLLKVVPSTDGKVHLNARMRVEGEKEKDIQLALAQFDMDISETGNQVIIETDLGIKNWMGRNNRINLTFKNGLKVKGLKKITAEILLAVPDLMKLELRNKYEDIIMDHDFKGDLEVYLYDGDLRAKDIGGELEMTIKYGKATIGNIADGDLTLYDSKMELEGGKDVRLSSKYSDYTIGDTESLTIKAYDDKMELGNIKGKFKIEDKYSEIEMENFGEAFLDIYDADFRGKRGGNLTIEGSKYSKYIFSSIANLEIEESYDDEFVLKSVENIEIAKSKYSEFDVGALSGKVAIGTSHDDELKIDVIESSFKGLKLDGKYTKIYMDIPSAVKYILDVEMTYGSIDYPEDNFENQFYKEKSSDLEVRGKIKGASDDAPKVIIKGYDCKIELE